MQILHEWWRSSQVGHFCVLTGVQSYLSDGKRTTPPLPPCVWMFAPWLRRCHGRNKWAVTETWLGNIVLIMYYIRDYYSPLWKSLLAYWPTSTMRCRSVFFALLKCVQTSSSPPWSPCWLNIKAEARSLRCVIQRNCEIKRYFMMPCLPVGNSKALHCNSRG